MGVYSGGGIINPSLSSVFYYSLLSSINYIALKIAMIAPSTFLLFHGNNCFHIKLSAENVQRFG